MTVPFLNTKKSESTFSCFYLGKTQLDVALFSIGWKLKKSACSVGFLLILIGILKSRYGPVSVWWSATVSIFCDDMLAESHTMLWQTVFSWAVLPWSRLTAHKASLLCSGLPLPLVHSLWLINGKERWLFWLFHGSVALGRWLSWRWQEYRKSPQQEEPQRHLPTPQWFISSR